MERAGPAAQRLVCPACNTRYDHGQFCAKDGTPLVRDAAPSKADLVGQILADRYRIVKLLGEGGMGQVYEAHHVNINKRFAIKLLRPEIVSNPEAVARFRQEAWSASSIGHENIVEIDDFATLPDGSVYLAMEFLQGRALAERMREEAPIEVAEALDIFIQVANGLAAAHGKGIVHRDMKPENIFLAEKHGRMVAKILDFGIAKVSGGEAQSLTRTGAIFGTPHYMSPEQAIGNPLDHRSDIYSVGVIMYEVFTGRVPFEAESFMGILTKHITAEPKRPREVAPDRHIAAEVEAVIMRAMAKEPAGRHPTMEALAQDLVEVAQLYAPQLLTPSGTRPVAPPRSSVRQAPALSAPLAAAKAPSQPLAVTPTPPAETPAATPSSGWTAFGATLEASRQKSQPMAVPTGGSQPMAAVDAAAVGAVAAPDTIADPSPPSILEPSPVAPAPRGAAVKIAIAVAVLVILGGGAAAYFLSGGPAPPKIDAVVTPKTGGPTAPATPKPEVPPPTTPTTKPAASSLVLVDSEPAGASIVRDGAILGETPETVPVEGGPISVVLKKEGYVDETVVIDPAKGRKMLVRLERVKGKERDKEPRPSSSGKQHGRLPAPPPATPDPPVVHAPAPPPHTPAPPPPTPPARKKPIDPYERLDDGPPRGNQKGGVLNPY
jgi:serine/threonine-protein kinase